MYKTTLSGQVWRFDSLKTLMAKASPARSGDSLAGIIATSAEERMAAKMALAEVPLTDILDNPLIPYGAEGEILLDGDNILTNTQDIALLRAKVGMVFQKPTPFPMSIYDNIAFGVRLFEKLSRADMDERVQWALTKAALWNETKDKLHQSGYSLSGGQQQRLCIARGIAIRPEVLLLDEPCSALDPISTGRIEELITELKQDYTVVIVTHNMQQAARCSDHTAFMYLGELIEFSNTDDLFTKPAKKQTEDYITGRYG